MLLASLDHDVSAAGVLHAQVDEPVEVPSVTPVLVEELEEDKLGDTAGVLRGDFSVAEEALNDLLGADDPAGTRSGGQDLGE